MDKISDKQLIGKDGRPNYGVYSGFINKLNLEDLRPYGKPNIWFVRQELNKRLRLKRWQYLGVCNEEVIFGLAVVHIGFLSNFFVYIFDRKLKALKEYNFYQPIGLSTEFTGSLADGGVSFSAKDISVKIENTRDNIKLNASVKNDLDVKLVFTNDIEPLSVVTRAGLKGFNYTTKEAGISVDGSIRLENKYFAVNPLSSTGVMDYNLGFPGRRTFWNWATGSGVDNKKRKIGFNFSCGINETSYTENAFWVGGKIFKVDQVIFKYDDLHLLSPWTIQSNDGKVNLKFYPEGERNSNLYMGLISSRFHQPFGKFSGELIDGKSKYVLDSVSGFVEEHESLW